MVLELQRQIVDAIRAGACIEEIGEAIIDPAPVDEDQRSALWLYAEALREYRDEAMLPYTDPVPLIG